MMIRNVICAVMILWFFNASTRAQHVEEITFALEDDQTLELDFSFAQSIEVEGSSRNKVFVRMTVEALNADANELMQWQENIGSSRYYLKSKPNWDVATRNDGVDCPSGWINTNRDDHRICIRLNYHVQLPRDARLHVESISGNIDIRGMERPVFAKTISGFVDMNWPADRPADVEMKSISGEVYSDLDLEWTGKHEAHPIVGYLVKVRTGEGGDTIHLESVSGNVYLRKAGQ